MMDTKTVNAPLAFIIGFAYLLFMTLVVVRGVQRQRVVLTARKQKKGLLARLRTL